MEDMAPDLEPEQIEIRRHISHLTSRWHELGEPALLEVVFLSADDKAQVKGVYHFSPDAAGLDAAADHVAKMNVHGLNAYCVVNPISATNRPPVNKRASRDHILASFFHWADADDARAAENIRNFVGPKHTFHVITGRHPSPRPHVYWELEEPTRNLDAWERTQRAIAATLKTDPSVVDPPRIMRLAGTINWPKPKKRAKGYIAELTRLKIYDEDGREPVSSERMARAFVPRADTQSEGFQFDTGEGRRAEDYADILRRARTDGEKHTGVRDLAASLAGMGVSRSMAEAIIRDACPVWDDNVEALINSAYEKFWRTTAGHASAEDQIKAMAEKAAGAGKGSECEIEAQPVTLADLESVQPRRWLYGRKMLRGFVSVVASPGGTGKSAWATAVACDMAGGANTLHDAPHGTLRVWLYNLEDPRDEGLRKVAACMKAKRFSEAILENLFVNSGRDRRLILAEDGPHGIVAKPDVVALIGELKRRRVDVLVVDPFVRAHTLEENDNKGIDFVMDLFAQVAHEADVGILLVHHTRKGFVPGEMDSIRGASSIGSAARVGLTMQTMTAEEAQAMNVPANERLGLVRIDSAKANLAPRASDAEWIRLVNQPLNNGTDEYPDGDHVQVVMPWTPPDAWDGLGEEKANEILDKIAYGFTTEAGTVEKYSARPQDKERWVGNAILSSFPPGDKSVEHCKRIIKTWLENGVIAEVEYYSQAQRKDRKGVDVRARPGRVTE